MASLDTYLHIITVEMLAILAVVQRLSEDKPLKRVFSTAFLALLGFMLAHFATHLLPTKIAAFIYSSHHEYHSIKNSGLNRT